MIKKIAFIFVLPLISISSLLGNKSFDYSPLAISKGGSLVFDADIIKDVSKYQNSFDVDFGGETGENIQRIIDEHHYFENVISSKGKTVFSGDKDVLKELKFSSTELIHPEFTDNSLNFDINSELRFASRDNFDYGKLFNYPYLKGGYENVIDEIYGNTSIELPCFVTQNINSYFVSNKNVDIFVVPDDTNLSLYTINFNNLKDYLNYIKDFFNYELIDNYSLPLITVDAVDILTVSFTSSGVNYKVAENCIVEFSKNTNGFHISLPQEAYLSQIKFLSLISSNEFKLGNTWVERSQSQDPEIRDGYFNNDWNYSLDCPFNVEFYSIDNNLSALDCFMNGRNLYQFRSCYFENFDVKNKQFTVVYPLSGEKILNENGYTNEFCPFDLNNFVVDFKNKIPFKNEYRTTENFLIDKASFDYIKLELNSINLKITYSLPDKLIMDVGSKLIVKKIESHSPFFVTSCFVVDFAYKEYDFKKGQQVETVYSFVETHNYWQSFADFILGKYYSEQFHCVYLYYDKEKTMPIQNVIDVTMNYQVGSDFNYVAPDSSDSLHYSISDDRQVYFNPRGKMPSSFTHTLSELVDVESVKQENITYSILQLFGGLITKLPLLKEISRSGASKTYRCNEEHHVGCFTGKDYHSHDPLYQVDMNLKQSLTGQFALLNKEYGINKNSGVINNSEYLNKCDELKAKNLDPYPIFMFYNEILQGHDSEFCVNWLSPATITSVNLNGKNVVPGSFWSDGRHIEYDKDGNAIGVFDRFGNLMEDLKVSTSETGGDIITDKNGNYQEPNQNTNIKIDEADPKAPLQNWIIIYASLIALGILITLFLVFKYFKNKLFGSKTKIVIEQPKQSNKNNFDRKKCIYKHKHKSRKRNK